METNHLTITGRVVDVGKCRVSPAGIPQHTFTIEHRSAQVEAGIPREARCRLDVKIAGEELTGMAREFVLGQSIRIEGFLARSGFRSGDIGIVVHATHMQMPSDATDTQHHG